LLRLRSVAHLVRSLRTCARNRSLTTGTFNQIVKDRIAFPPERSRIQSRRIWPTDRSLPCRNPAVLETFQPYLAPKNAVNAHIPQNFHEISTSGRSERRTDSAMAFRRASKIGLPPGKALLERPRLFGRAKAEDRKLRKELTFGGPCLEGTLQKPTGVSESSPVAGAIEESISSFNIRCRARTRDTQTTPD